MIGLQFRFLAGRYHGTDWQHAHNEGVPEWPPSPWRVLRALVSSAFLQELERERVESLLLKLSGLPSYRLPSATPGHTRHFMPDTGDPNQKRAKVFDAFVAVDGGARNPQPLTMAWPVDLSSNERALLTRLCLRIPYLGRAESWTEATVVDVSGDDWDCVPGQPSERGHSTTLLAPTPADELAAWSATRAKPKKGADWPRTLWDVLSIDAARYRSEGWSSVPGTRLVRYQFARRPLAIPTIAAPLRRPRDRPTVARYAIRAPVLPRVQDALSVADRLRVAVMSQSRRIVGDARPVFSGHADVSTNHHHAMYLCASDDPRNAGRIDTLIISAKAGFEREDIAALQSVRRIWGREGSDLELILLGVGQAEDFGGLNAPHSKLLGRSRVWQSVTPFIPTRFPKTVRGAQKDSVEEQILVACDRLLGVAPAKVTPVGDRAEWAAFGRRRRNGKGRRGPDWPLGARLEFATPVRGPIALGFGAHFGLGLFEAVREPTN